MPPHTHTIPPRSHLPHFTPHVSPPTTPPYPPASSPTVVMAAVAVVLFLSMMPLPSIAFADESNPSNDSTTTQKTTVEPDPTNITTGSPGHALTDIATLSRPMRFSILWENDGGYWKFNNPHDRHYTNGVKMSLAWQPDWAQHITDALPLARGFQNTETAFGVVAGQDIYTPQIITTTIPDPTDHPYAGWLYTGAYVQRADRQRGLFDHLEINLGMLGPSAGAKGTQQGIHDLIGDQDDPSGWGSQLGDEFGFNLIYQRKWRYDLMPRQSAHDSTTDAVGTTTWGAQFIPQAGFILGTMQRQANLGLNVRWGWNLPDDFGPARIRDLGDATRITPTDKLAAYVFAQINGTVVEHNTFVEGNNYKSSPGHQTKPLVGDATVGLAIAWKRLQLSYYQTFMTDTFDGQRGSDSYAGWVLAWSFHY